MAPPNPKSASLARVARALDVPVEEMFARVGRDAAPTTTGAEGQEASPHDDVGPGAVERIRELEERVARTEQEMAELRQLLERQRAGRADALRRVWSRLYAKSGARALKADELWGKERDDTKAGAASAKVVPLWPTSIREDLPTATSNRLPGASEPTSRDLVATADTYNLDPRQSSGSPRTYSRSLRAPATALQVAESARLRLSRTGPAAAGSWWTRTALCSADRAIVGGWSWLRHRGLGAKCSPPAARCYWRHSPAWAARAATASVATPPPPDPEAAARLDYVMQHPRSVDMAAAAHLRERAESLAKQYDLAALDLAGSCSRRVHRPSHLPSQAGPDGPVLRELQVTEAQLATLMGQLVWDASQRRDHATAVSYDQAISAANRAGETTMEAYARLRKSCSSPYGEHELQAGLRLAQQAATLADTAGSHALQGLALLHVGEGYAMLDDRRQCEDALMPRRRISRPADRRSRPRPSPPTASGRIQGSLLFNSLATAPRQDRSWRALPAAFRVVTSRRPSSSGTWPRAPPSTTSNRQAVLQGH